MPVLYIDELFGVSDCGSGRPIPLLNRQDFGCTDKVRSVTKVNNLAAETYLNLARHRGSTMSMKHTGGNWFSAAPRLYAILVVEYVFLLLMPPNAMDFTNTGGTSLVRTPTADWKR